MIPPPPGRQRQVNLVYIMGSRLTGATVRTCLRKKINQKTPNLNQRLLSRYPLLHFSEKGVLDESKKIIK